MLLDSDSGVHSHVADSDKTESANTGLFGDEGSGTSLIYEEPDSPLLVSDVSRNLTVVLGRRLE